MVHIIINKRKMKYKVLQKEFTQAIRWLKYTKEANHSKCCAATTDGVGNYCYQGEEPCVEGC